MFFAKLNGSSNPNHPSNSDKNTVKVAKLVSLPPATTKSRVDKTPKKRSKSRSHTPLELKSPSSSKSRHSTITPDPELVVDTKREYFKEPSDDQIKTIEGKDIAVDKRYKKLFDRDLEFVLELPYGQERYKAVEPEREDDLDLMGEIETVMETVGGFTDRLTEIKDPQMKDCIIRRMRKSISEKSRDKFIDAIDDFNTLVVQCRDEGTFEATIRALRTNHRRLDFDTISNLLNMVYARVVSPHANDLRNYVAFSNNVYGELLPKFASKIFLETGLTSDKVFVDLGSGVGNCVLQAALEVGCESYGCEMMQTAASLAVKQQKELEARAAQYGLAIGGITLKESDFTQDSDISMALSKADVLLVNNYAFDNELNGSLVNMFLDLKDGCQVVSLKSFVPEDHVISERNIHSPLNILAVKKKHFGTDCVSWTNAGGVYYVATVDRSRIQKFL